MCVCVCVCVIDKQDRMGSALHLDHVVEGKIKEGLGEK